MGWLDAEFSVVAITDFDPEAFLKNQMHGSVSYTHLTLPTILLV